MLIYLGCILDTGAVLPEGEKYTSGCMKFTCVKKGNGYILKNTLGKFKIPWTFHNSLCLEKNAFFLKEREGYLMFYRQATLLSKSTENNWVVSSHWWYWIDTRFAIHITCRKCATKGLSTRWDFCDTTFFVFIFDCTCALADQSRNEGIAYEHYCLCPGWPISARKSFKWSIVHVCHECWAVKLTMYVTNCI
jgi:hypothetical protein